MQVASALDSRWPEVVGAISEAIDLEATARSSGALIRRREIRTAEQLLRLALAYGPGGLSLRARRRPGPGSAASPTCPTPR